MSRITVLMAAYNSQDTIAESIQSILNQTYKDFEFLIINDGSQDSTREIALGFNDERIKYYEHENIGLAKSLNRGLKLATGEFIARLDSDDIAYPNRLEEQLKFMLAHPEYVICGSSADIYSTENLFLYCQNMPSSNEEIRVQINMRNCFIHPSTFFRKEAAFQAGLYYEPIKNFFEDYILFHRMTSLGKSFNFKVPLIKYQVGAYSMSSDKPTRQQRMVLRKIIDAKEVTEEEIKQTRPLGVVNRKKSLSNFYLLHARNFATRNVDLKTSLKYFYKAIKTSFFNVNTMLSIAYIPLFYLKKTFGK